MPRTEIRKQTLPTVKHAPMNVPKPILTQPAPLSAPTFGQTIKEGIGFGAGSAIGHRIIGSILGSPSSAQSPPPTTAVAAPSASQTCWNERNAFENCLKTRGQEDQCSTEFLSYSQCIQLN